MSAKRRGDARTTGHGANAQGLGPWRCVEGGRPNQVIIEERLDRKNRLVIRWWQSPAPAAPGTGSEQTSPAPGRWQKVFLDTPHPRAVRDATGALELTSVARARGLAAQVYLVLREGRDPMPIVSPHAQVRAPAPAATAPATGATPAGGAPALSIRQSLDLAFAVDAEGKPAGGLYLPGTRHAREARAAALKACDMVEAMFAKGCGWNVLKPSTWRDLGLRLLARKRPLREAVAKAPGVRSAQLAVAELAAAARWLVREGHLTTVTQPAPQWRAALQKHFTAVTNLSVDPARPRHTVEEAGQLYRAALDMSNSCDPRIRLVVRLGLELRAGQVLRVRRSALNLDPVGGFLAGTLRVVGSGKKKGVTLDLTPEDREAIDWALDTYLGNLEKAFLCGRLPDYYLVPGRTLNAKGMAPVRPLAELQPLGRRHALALFRELEQLAGVTSIAGRGWYGLRRLGSDLTDKATKDEAVRVGAGGWTGSRVRREIYVDQNDPKLRAEIAKVRRKVRRGLVKAPVRPHTSPKGKKPGDAKKKNGA